MSKSATLTRKKNLIKHLFKVIKANKDDIQSIDFDYLRNNIDFPDIEILETRIIIAFRGSLKQPCKK